MVTKTRQEVRQLEFVLFFRPFVVAIFPAEARALACTAETGDADR
jgi:hypothetical protein